MDRCISVLYLVVNILLFCSMNPREFRIDNVVKFRDKIGKVCNITLLDDGHSEVYLYGVEGEIMSGALSEVVPVVLTEEILKKCGFKKDEAHDCYVVWQSESNVDIEYFDNQIHLVGQNSAEPLPIKYLHQLQNLIFVLTGEELNVQL